ncbi:2-keto-4-pentenoate hydratase/2-oxohepta-3-ene-1,7-dioic acid hydratase in catechol pathway [Bradyrhizobium sp. i1.3.1]
MTKTTRRSVLTAAAAMTAAGLTEAAPAAAQAAPKPIFPVPMVAIPIVGETQVFQVRRIYCIGRNYAAHAIERGSDPNREPPFFFQKPTDAIQNVAVGEVADHPYPSLTKNYHHEVELVRRAEIGRHQHPGRQGARSRLWLRARPRHDPARSPERHGRGKEALGDRQEL